MNGTQTGTVAGTETGTGPDPGGDGGVLPARRAREGAADRRSGRAVPPSGPTGDRPPRRPGER
ncbi:hypothetical protein EAO68_17380 [Streptomyces sp. wa22]|nr:hypothetical protein EAO68_17380 [Streptomyces sp. wa22]